MEEGEKTMIARHYFNSLAEVKAYIPTFRKNNTFTNSKGMSSSITPTILKCREKSNKGKYMILENVKP